MSSSILNVTVPQPGIKFLDQDGEVSRVWYYFLISLFTRTGGNTPIPPSTLQNQVDALFAEATGQDVEFPPPPSVFSVLAAQAMADDARGPGINPFLAALAVETDVTQPQMDRVFTFSDIAPPGGAVTGAIFDATSIVLRAGKWLVYGNVTFTGTSGAAASNFVAAWTSASSVTFPTTNNGGGFTLAPYASAAGFSVVASAGVRRLDLAISTTIYLSAQIGIAGGAFTAAGFIGAIPI